mgnify:CR=1 FL=1
MTTLYPLMSPTLSEMDSVTNILDAGSTPEQLLELLLGGLGLEINAEASPAALVLFP